MACAFAGNSCTVTSSRLVFNRYLIEPKKRQSLYVFKVRASTEDSDCNDEECAPDKENPVPRVPSCSKVGKLSMGWRAEDNTKVVGTFPPRKRGWTGYVEKDTAGQTNIYSVEPAVYVAESAISSGSSGSSSDGAENTVAIAAGLALVFVAAASTLLLQIGKNPPVIQTADYTGPSLSYYITKFSTKEMAEATVPTVTETLASLQTESSAPQFSLQTESSAPRVSEAKAEVSTPSRDIS